MPGGLRLPARMVVAMLADGGLWLWSATAIDDALAIELDELGPVRHIVAPNCFHHLHLGSASARWPAAKVHAPAGLKAKRPDLRIDHELRDGDQPWGEAFVLVHIAGAAAIDEFAFLHQPSASLLLCDLVFNVHEAPLMTRLLLRMVGVWRRLRQSRLWRSQTKDRAAAGHSCESLLNLDFHRIIPAHGHVAEGPDVHEQLRNGLEWMLAGQ